MNYMSNTQISPWIVNMDWKVHHTATALKTMKIQLLFCYGARCSGGSSKNDFALRCFNAATIVMLAKNIHLYFYNFGAILYFYIYIFLTFEFVLILSGWTVCKWLCGRRHRYSYCWQGRQGHGEPHKKVRWGWRTNGWLQNCLQRHTYSNKKAEELEGNILWN